MAERTILFQPPNRVGLGHLSRLIAIALAIKQVRPEVRLPFVVGGDEHGLLEAHGFPYFCLPDRQAMYESGAWEAWPVDARHPMIMEVASTLLKVLRPELIVFDCFPHPALMQAAYRQGGINAAICLRVMKDMSGHFREIRKVGARVQAILIPHDEGECEVPEDMRSRTCFTGPITRPLPALPAPVARSPGDGARFVVISGGGGGYPGTVAFYNLALEALVRARREMPGIEGLLVTGPLFHDWWELRTVEGVRVMPFDPQLAGTLARADLVVSQAGYNTIAELRALGVPTLCVPADRDSDDQFKRAAEAASHGRLRTCTDHDPETLARLMIDMLSDDAVRARPAAVPAPSGAAVAAETLLRLLDRIECGAQGR